MKLPVTPIMMGFCYNPVNGTYYGASMYHNKEHPLPIPGVTGKNLREVATKLVEYLCVEQSVAISEIFESNIFDQGKE